MTYAEAYVAHYGAHMALLCLHLLPTSFNGWPGEVEDSRHQAQFKRLQIEMFPIQVVLHDNSIYP